VIQAAKDADLAIEAIEDLLRTAISLAVQAAIRFAVFTGVDLVGQGAVDAVVFPDHNPFKHLDFSAAVSEGLDRANPTWQLRSPVLRVIAEGLSNGALNAASQEVRYGHVSALGAAGSALFGSAGVAWRLHKTTGAVPVPLS